MNAPNFKIEEIFAEAIERPLGQRLDWVRDKCGENLDLFESVMNLVRGHEKNRQDNFLQDPFLSEFQSSDRHSSSILFPGAGSETTGDRSDVDSDFLSSSQAIYEGSSTFRKLNETTAGPDSQFEKNNIKAIGEKIGDHIDRYQLLEKIGEGGMGTVYLAKQTSDVIRNVALKIIKLGMDTQQVCNRFETERQAMAMFNHPHIAKVLDAGSTDSGRPYFVMEWVQGTTITKFCNGNDLNIDRRLQLFIQLCQAVRHAHQKGIVHRDLKPGNILVTQIDGECQPKVIDFGIAKALDGDLHGSTSITSTSALIGTPQYMSPEQAKFGQIEIDGRSDVYSLGIVLYELLTGKTPLDGEALKKANPLALFETIEESEFQLPSTQLKENKFGEPFGFVAKNVKGSLDNIVMKAISFDPDSRYESVEDLLNDVQNFLDGNPVSAGRPSRFGKLRRFFTRYRSTAAACLLLTAVFAGATATCYYYADQAYRSQVAHKETIQKLETRQSEFQELDQKLQSKDQAIKEVGNKLKSKSNQLESVKEEIELQRQIGIELSKYHNAHITAMNNTTDFANDAANGIQFELIKKHFGPNEGLQVIQELLTSGQRFGSTAGQKPSDHPFIYGRQHHQSTARNSDKSQPSIPKIRFINWNFNDLNAMRFKVVDTDVIHRYLDRIDKTIEVKSSLLKQWNHDSSDHIRHKFTSRSQQYFADHLDSEGLFPVEENPSMDPSKKTHCCKFHQELDEKIRILSQQIKPYFYRELVAQYENEFGVGDPRVADAKELLAAAYMDVGKWYIAKTILSQAHSLRLAAARSNNPLHKPHASLSTLRKLRKIRKNGESEFHRTSQKQENSPVQYSDNQFKNTKTIRSIHS